MIKQFQKYNKSEIAVSVVMAVFLFICCIPSFNLIGNMYLQIILPVFFAALLCIFFMLRKMPIRIMGTSLSVFLYGVMLIAFADQIYAQFKQYSSSGEWAHRWIYRFYYDKPLIVCVVWASVFVFFAALRLREKDIPKNSERHKEFAVFFRKTMKNFFVFYLAILIYCFIIIRPIGQTNIDAVVSLSAALRQYKQLLYVSPYEGLMMIGGNILIFLPLGFIIKALKPRMNFFLYFFIGFAMSSLVEISQYLLKTGMPDLSDVILNVFGFLIGGLTVILINKICKSVSKGRMETIFE